MADDGPDRARGAAGEGGGAGSGPRTAPPGQADDAPRLPPFDRQRLDAAWVRGLERRPELAERLEVLVSRFGRMRDTIAQRLLPRWLVALAGVPGSQIETLNRAERLGVLAITEHWLEARQLRNRLAREHSTRPEALAADRVLARDHAGLLLDTFNRLLGHARRRMAIGEERLPGRLELPAGG